MKHREIIHDYDHKIVLIPHRGKAFKVLSAEWWSKSEFKEKKSLEQKANTLVCLCAHGKYYLFLYLEGGAIKIEEAEVFDYDVVIDRIKSKNPKIFGKNQKDLMCKALGYQKAGWETANQIFWL